MDQAYTLEDLRTQVRRFREAGTDAFPSISDVTPADLVDLERTERILEAMTAEERRHLEGLDQQARERIALVSNTRPEEVTKLITLVANIQKLVREIRRSTQ